MRKLAFLFFISVFIISCSGKKKVPKDILPKEKMQAVLWSMINAGEFLNAYVLNKDSIDKIAESAKVYGQVLQVYNITKDQFDKSYNYYREHPELMKVILDSLSKKQNNIPQPTQDNQDTITRKKPDTTIAPKKLIKSVELEKQ